MRQLVTAFLLFVSLTFATNVQADFDQSKSWFETLSTDERTDTQANLTLLGYYNYLIDGQFGAGTFNALVAFQRAQGRATTGVLIPRDQQKLIKLATAVYSELGMDLVRDKEGQSALTLPLSLLTTHKATKRGNIYATADDGISLETIRRPASESAFVDLFDEFKRAVGRVITYENYNDDRFVLSGTEDGRSFYMMFQNAETDSVGYRISWSDDNAERANMLAIFIASHFTPLRYMPPEEGEDVKIAVTPQATQTFGVFSLPANAPEAIMLNGEVTHTLANDFARALEVRPHAKVIVLNSPGGYVDNALQVAHEVRERHMSTLVAQGMGCYSACAYIFFAGENRYAQGELGVHQISAEVADLVLAQTTLSDVLDALDEFGVEQPIISVMLRTPPEDMHVFTLKEVADLGINAGEPVRVAQINTLGPSISTNVPLSDTDAVPVTNGPETGPSVGSAYVELALQGSEDEANRSLDYARQRWSGVLGDAVPEVEREKSSKGTVYHVRVPARSLESANALCAAIKSAGGGCYVTHA